MVGSFQTFFFQNEVGFESMLGIWLHGTLEISAIILAGGAGLTLGRGLLFPGTFTRFEAFQMSAQRGIKVMLGITPVFIIAGFIESFATRFTDAPSILQINHHFCFLVFYSRLLRMDSMAKRESRIFKRILSFQDTPIQYYKNSIR